MNKEKLIGSFAKEYSGSCDNIECFFSPGRVNLIGEHIDYNGGYVFPAALSLGIYAALRYRNDNIIRLKSTNTQGEVIIDLSKEIKYDEKDSWGNYPKGVIKYILNEGYSIKGCEVLFTSTLPDGAGLSSSAALEVLTGYMMLYPELGEEIDRVWLARLCQKVENQFIGVNCGIMDQFSVAVGKKDNAILLDCSSLKYEYAPFKLDSYSLVIMNTNKRRELADSKYNERRRECDNAVEMLNRYKKIVSLCEASIEDIEKYIKDETIFKRAKHAVTENERVLKAVKVLKEGKLDEFGKLLVGSHMSLKNDYEVTGLHLDTIVEEALSVDGCIGARMTGAGFGGCAIALVENSQIDSFISKVSKGYNDKTGIKPAFYISVIEDGVKHL